MPELAAHWEEGNDSLIQPYSASGQPAITLPEANGAMLEQGLCWWPDQGALPAKGKEYPGLGYKRLRDKPPKAQQQQQQPAEAQ
ncbi:hypothetical protein QJQ45_003470 [Haematococcus lacustris]|nr:hypothetical protein QJQ45_003470 [Haematococcus lacustris]